MMIDEHIQLTHILKQLSTNCSFLIKMSLLLIFDNYCRERIPARISTLRVFNDVLVPLNYSGEFEELVFFIRYIFDKKY